MKNYVWCLLIAGVAVTLNAPPSVAQSKARQTETKAPALSKAEIASVVKADVQNCASKVPVIPTAAVRSFGPDRVSKTLNGIWRGRVSGQYDKQFLAKDGYLNVDYYMIVDVKAGEVLVLEQLSSKRAVEKPRSANPAAWSFLMCGKEKYLPRHPPQVHEFQKVSDNLDDARAILEKSTGLKMEANKQLSLSSAWQKLVDQEYFDNAKFPAYAGGIFKPFQVGAVQSEGGGSQYSISYQAEYRGSGETAARFTKGVPARGKESARFVGLTTENGDYLVASNGNGLEWEKVAESGALMNVFFEQVVIGPLVN
jgi:hypothetical protein